MDDIKEFAKKYPGFTGYLTVCVLLFIGGIVYYFIAKGNADQAYNLYEQKESMRTRALRYEIAPTEANLELAKANVEALKANLDKRKAKVSGEDTELLADIPSDPDKMFFEIKSYIDFFTNEAAKTIQDAQTGQSRTNVKLPDNFRFGFGYFIDKTAKGPPSEHIKNVFVQKQVLNFLMSKLFEAQPLALETIHRTPIVEDPKTMQLQEDGTFTYDLFLVDELTSARQPGAVTTMGFRIVFNGYTSSLRGLLVGLPEFQLPLVVRSVEVEPPTTDLLEEDRGSSSLDAFGSAFAGLGGGDDEDNPAGEPIVDNNVSKYTVIVELIQVQEEQSEDADKEEDRRH